MSEIIKSSETNDFKDLYDRLKKEVCISEAIKRKMADVCNYMWEHELSMISMEYATNVNFRLTMEIKETADDRKQETEQS